MHAIEKTGFGLQIKLSGKIAPDEMDRWFNDEKLFLSSVPPHPFGAILDLRELEPLSAESLAEFAEGQKLMKEKGLERLAVVVDGAETKAQFQQVARQTGTDAWTRYLDARRKEGYWKDVATAWVAEGKEPPPT